MAETNEEVVRLAVQAFSEEGFSSERAASFLDAEVVFEEPPEQPAPRTAHGRAATIEMFGQFDEAWEEHRSVIETLETLEGDRVLALTVEHFRGRDGIEIEQPCGSLFTLRNGKIIRMQVFWERESARSAAGLSH